MSIKEIEFMDILDKLKLKIDDFSKGRSCFSRFGIKDMYMFNGITVHSGEYIILNISGEGCRTLETLYNNDLNWINFINDLLMLDGNISRLDIAIDDKQDENNNNILNMNTMFKHLEKYKYITRAQNIKYTKSPLGTEEQILIGSGKSKKLVRIYNKALERGYTESYHWIRVEMQLRDYCAAQFFFHLHNKDIGKVAGGTLLNLFNFITKPYHGIHSNRFNTAPWWTKFIETTEKLKNIKIGGLVYNEKMNEKYVEVQAISSIKTYIAINNGDVSKLLTKVDGAKYNKKQQMLLKEKRIIEQNEIV